jgi:hypothetical protein
MWQAIAAGMGALCGHVVKGWAGAGHVTFVEPHGPPLSLVHLSQSCAVQSPRRLPGGPLPTAVCPCLMICYAASCLEQRHLGDSGLVSDLGSYCRTFVLSATKCRRFLTQTVVLVATPGQESVVAACLEGPGCDSFSTAFPATSSKWHSSSSPYKSVIPMLAL